MRSRLVLAVKTLVSVALVTWVLLHAGLQDIGATLRDVSPGWLAAGYLAGIAAALLQANQWRGLLSALGLPRSYRRCVHLDTAARVFDAAMPTSIGGDVARIALVCETPADRTPAALSVAMRRLASLPGLVLVLAAGVALTWQEAYASRVRPVAVAFVLGGVALAGLLLAVSGARRSVPLPRPVAKLADAWTEARRRSEQGGGPVLRAALRGLCFWLVVVLSQWCFIRAVGSTAPLAYSALVVTTVNALSLLPISLGGYGLREGAFASFLAVGGFAAPSQGAAVGVCLSAQTVLFGLVGGLAYLTVGRSARPLPAAVPGTPALASPGA